MNSGEELEHLGLSRAESRVYLALIHSGAATTGPIVDNSKVSPSKIYWILEKLMQKGLVSYVIKAKTKVYSATSPQKILDYLEEQKNELEKRTQSVKEILPRLINMQNNSRDQQTAEVFVGFAAMKNAYYTMYDSALKGDTHMVFLRSAIEEGKEEAIVFFNQLHKKAVEKGLKRKLIAPGDEESKNLFLTGVYAKRKNDEVRFIESSPGGINILNDKLLLMHLSNDPICVLITSKQLASDYRKLFDQSWKLARKK